jgi:hypothetical protein
MLWPVHFTLAYVGYDVLAPFVAYGVEAGLRYSDPAAIEERLKAIVADFRALLPASTSAGRSRSIAWRNGARTAGSRPGPRSIRHSSAASRALSWSDQANGPRLWGQAPRFGQIGKSHYAGPAGAGRGSALDLRRPGECRL